MTQQRLPPEQIALKAHIAEYEGIWGEVHAQLDVQSNLLNYVIALIAASAALLSIGTPTIAERIPALVLVASLLLLAMAWEMLDTTYQLNDLGAYNEQVVGRKIQALIGEVSSPHLQVMQWNSARIYRGPRIYLKALLSAGKFAFAYIPGLALMAAFRYLRPPSQLQWTSTEQALFWLAVFMAAVSVLAAVHSALFIRRRAANLFADPTTSLPNDAEHPSTRSA
jgi:hypothetical protein